MSASLPQASKAKLTQFVLTSKMLHAHLKTVQAPTSSADLHTAPSVILIATLTVPLEPAKTPLLALLLAAVHTPLSALVQATRRGVRSICQFHPANVHRDTTKARNVFDLCKGCISTKFTSQIYPYIAWP